MKFNLYPKRNNQKNSTEPDATLSRGCVNRTRHDLREKFQERFNRALRAMATCARLNHSLVYLDTCEFGIGVFASQRIAAGSSILTFSGPRMTFDEAVMKGDRQCYTLQIGVNEYVDLSAPGCYVNHSCKPNSGVRGLELFAIDEIRKGEELRFDYSTTMDEDYWRMECHCRKSECRRIIGDFKYLPLEIRSRYIELKVVADFIVARSQKVEERVAS